MSPTRNAPSRLLVTGFGPFPRVPRNRSGPLARAVAASPRWRLRGVETELRILTTSYAALTEELDPALASGPAAILLIGVAGRSPIVRVERRATARRSTLFPDAAGTRPSRSAGGGREARRSRVGMAEALRLLRRRGVRARISRDAGRYLCNAAYHRALAERVPAVFIHIPLPRVPGRPSWRLVAALVDLGLAMLRDSRRVEAGRSPV